jgi:hypothetical protein
MGANIRLLQVILQKFMFSSVCSNSEITVFREDGHGQFVGGIHGTGLGFFLPADTKNYILESSKNSFFHDFQVAVTRQVY